MKKCTADCSKCKAQKAMFNSILKGCAILGIGKQVLGGTFCVSVSVPMLPYLAQLALWFEFNVPLSRCTV